MRVGKKVSFIGSWLLAIPILLGTSFAQVQVGEDVKMNLNGSLGTGYGGSFDTLGASSHNINLTGTGTLSGSYYNPNFLSFTVQPYYNRNQDNAASQSIFNESGLTATTNIFSGSRFPGYISYGKTYNSSGEFGIPGVAGLTTDGSGQSFGVGWSLLFPNLPTLTVDYNDSSNSSTVIGSPGELNSAFKNLNISSHYNLSGWNLLGVYTHQNMSLDVPAFLEVGSAANTSTSSSNSLGTSVDHRLPMNGNFSASWTRTTFDSNSSSNLTNGSTDTTDAMVAISPTSRLNLIGDLRFTSNLAGALLQNVVTAGGPNVLFQGGSDSHALGLNAFANYSLTKGLMLSGRISHQRLYYGGQDFDTTQYGGTVSYNYQRPLFGLLYFSFGLFDNAQETGNTGVSYNANVGMKRNFGHWETSADYSYSQNVQTLVTVYTTNSMNYGGFVRRILTTNAYWTASYRASQSGILQDRTSTGRTNNFSSNLGWRGYTLTGNYSRSSGRTVLTTNGLLTPSPLPGLLPDDLVLFNGTSYSVGASASPLRRMVVTYSYTNTYGDTLSNTLFSTNEAQRTYTRLDYNLRKLVLRAGYSRTHQGLSASGVLPVTFNSYFFGISRWFNVF